MSAAPTRAIRPQPAQERFLASPADIAIYGGAAGGGKSWALLLEPIRHRSNPEFGAVVFRRTHPQITAQGGLWDEAGKLYPPLGATANQGTLSYAFPSGARVKFAHLQHDKNVYDWQGSQIPLLCFDELTHFCYSPVMETLTETGWKKIADVKPGERVLALTPSGVARYEEVTAAWGFDFDGDMHETKNRSIRYSVTSNHKMVIRRQGRTGWEFCEAKDLDRFPLFPFDSEWSGEEREWVELPLPTGRGVGRNQNSAPRIAADDYLSLLGWYLAEGCSFLATKRKSSPVVYVRQTKDSADLAALMGRLPYRVCHTHGEGYRIFSRQLYAHFKPMGDLYQKRVPRWVLSLSQRQLRLVFDAFALGDGQRIKNGAVAFGLANEGLVDDLQEIAAKLGYRSTKAAGRGGQGNRYVVHRLYVHARRGGVVHDRPENKRLVPYKGKVYCLTVEPSHTLLVRHEGRVSWSGNSEAQFFYLLSRNRSLCGIRPYVRATCNPDADSWVAGLLAWWIDPDTGLPVPERAGRMRWFVRVNDRLVWADTAEELCRQYPDVQPKSLAFIPARLQDNQALMRADPGYLANLLALPLVERERLLGGNWKIRPSAGLVFNRGWFVLVEAAPAGLLRVRYWDKAATEDGGAWTCGVLMGRDYHTGLYYVLDVVRGQWSSLERDRVMENTARLDGPDVSVWVEQEPGSGGKESAEASVRLLAGASVHTERVTGDKITRAGPYSAQCEAGNVRLLRNPGRDWITPYIDELHGFPSGKYADQVDASSGAFNKLAGLFAGPYQATSDERALSAFHDAPQGVFAS